MGCGHPPTLPPQSRRAATARRDSGEGAEARVPYRRRRAHSHRPGLSSDKWGASCPDGGAVADGRRRASGARRLGRRRSYGGPGPYEAGPAADTASAWSVPRTCTHPLPPRNPPLQGRRASDPSTDPHDSQSKEASQSKNQPPLFPPDPLQKSEKKVKDNLNWRIN